MDRKTERFFEEYDDIVSRVLDARARDFLVFCDGGLRI